MTLSLSQIITGIAVSQRSSFWYDIIRQIKGEAKKSNPDSGESSGSAPGFGSEPSVGALTDTTPGKPPQ